MAVNDQQSRLGCGRLVDDVWATADQPPDAHELTCPFCQQARASMQQLAEATDALSEHEDEDPDFTPGIHVKDFIMQLVHVEVRRGRPIPLLNPEPAGAPPDLTISEQAVLDVVWRAADVVPGVRARHCAVHLDPVDQQPGRPATVAIDLHIAVATGMSVPQLTGRLRRQLADEITAETGLTTRTIAVTVEDLYDA